MSTKGMDFPQYRKLSNGKVFYKIIGNREFYEIQLLGESMQVYKIHAVQYPEILKIQDLLNLNFVGYVESSEEEYEES